jgi:hypothetical protein
VYPPKDAATGGLEVLNADLTCDQQLITGRELRVGAAAQPYADFAPLKREASYSVPPLDFFY